MPCMIITGYPASGKSAIVERIRQRALHLQLVEQVVIVSEHSAVGKQHNDKNNYNNTDHNDNEDQKSKTNHDHDNHGITSYYQDTLTEKKTRGALKAAFDRAVSNKATDKTLVILDALNYIKGVRYELHCISKAANQKHAVVWIVNDSYQTQQQTQTRQEQIIQELISRYEPPDARNRWDSPLYIVDLRQDNNNNNTAMKQVMEQTVYNMHQLSDALESGDKQPNDNNTAQQQVKVPALQQLSNGIPLVVGGGDDDDSLNDSVAVAAAATKPKPTKTTTTTTKSGFKRAGFLRNTTVANTVSSAEEKKNDTPTNTFEPNGTSSNNASHSTIHENNKTTDDSTVSKKKSLEEQIDELLQDFLGDRVKPLQQGTSTVQHIASETDLLNRVDSLTQQVCRGIMTAQQQQQQQQATTTASYSIIVHSVAYSFHGPRNSNMATLRQWRKQYIQWMAAHPPPEKQSDAALVQSFLDFLQTKQQQ